MSLPESLAEFIHGSIINLDNMTQLTPFEEMVADKVHPEMRAAQHLVTAWGSRLMLKECLRPAGFEGSLNDIMLVAMGDPYHRLCTVNERRLRFQSGTKPNVN